MFKRLLSAIRSTQAGSGETRPTSAASQGEPKLVEERDITTSFAPKERDRSPSRERIAVHAYYRWLLRGKPAGTELEDWFEAERQLELTA